MTHKKPSYPHGSRGGAAARRRFAFTLIELLVVVAVIAILAGLLLPALARSKEQARGVYCKNNIKQLALGLTMYSDDSATYLPYNMGGWAAATNFNNWTAGWLDWSATNPDNTNTATVTQAALGPYVNRVAAVFRCPSDNVLSAGQMAAGWPSRVRSYSMNAQIGNAGSLSQWGTNINNPSYVQFFKSPAIPTPTSIFVFIEEHPDSVSDGYFVDQIDGYNWQYEWERLPASAHNGGANLSFADGHVEYHYWQCPSTKAPYFPYAVNLPEQIPANEMADYTWLTQRMSVDSN